MFILQWHCKQCIYLDGGQHMDI
uniref:Uncharacterized protein n=1 Tax=Vitis vinifera TaxID=29760 RepID=F6HVS7_VITVI